MTDIDKTGWLEAAATFSQAETEALVDLMVWAMHADAMVHDDEHDQLVDLLWELEWDSDESVDQYYREATTRAEQVLGNPDQAAAYLSELVGRLGSPEARKVTLTACHSMADADGARHADEAAFLSKLQAALGL